MCEAVAKAVKKRMGAKAPLIVIGNVMPTFGGAEILDIDAFKDAIVVVGEGEVSIEQIAKAIREHPDTYKRDKSIYLDIPNLMFRRLPGENPITTTRKVLRTGDYRLPNADEAIEYFAHEGSESSIEVPIETSRGCYWNRCSFCSIKVLCSPENLGWRPFAMSDVLSRIKTFAENGRRIFHIIDSEFAGPVVTDEDFDRTMQRMEDFARGIIRINEELGLTGKDKIRITIISVRADTFFKKNKAARNKRSLAVLNLLKEAGLEKIFIGVESGSAEQLVRYKKGIRVDESIGSVQRIRDVGLELEVGFVYFDPFVNLSELRDNIRFIEQVRLYDTNSRLYKPLRAQAGSPVVDRLRQEGLLVNEDLSLINLSFPYRYQDDTGLISYLELLHNEWEAQIHPLSRYLITLHRNELDSLRRDALSRLMNHLRYLDFRFMQGIVMANTEAERISARIQVLDELRNFFNNIADSVNRGDYPERLKDEFIVPAIVVNQKLRTTAIHDRGDTVTGTIDEVLKDL
jgi:hypothetical protein